MKNTHTQTPHKNPHKPPTKNTYNNKKHINLHIHTCRFNMKRYMKLLHYTLSYITDPYNASIADWTSSHQALALPVPSTSSFLSPCCCVIYMVLLLLYYSLHAVSPSSYSISCISSFRFISLLWSYTYI